MTYSTLSIKPAAPESHKQEFFSFTFNFVLAYNKIMKRILLILLFTFFVLSLSFCEEIELFPWNTTKQSIFNSLESKGWSYKENDKGLYTFTPRDNKVTHRDEPVASFSFQFNKADVVITQNLVLNDGYNLATGFYVILCEAVDDKAKLIDFKYEIKNEVNIYSYFAELENCNSTYMFFTSDDMSIINLMYTTLPYK